MIAKMLGIKLPPKTLTMADGKVMRIGDQVLVETGGGFECQVCQAIVTRTFQAEEVQIKVSEDANLEEIVVAAIEKYAPEAS